MVGVYCDYMVLVLVLFVAAHAQRNSEESGHTYYSFIHTMDKYLVFHRFRLSFDQCFIRGEWSWPAQEEIFWRQTGTAKVNASKSIDLRLDQIIENRP